jgi:hypothetical protein
VYVVDPAVPDAGLTDTEPPDGATFGGTYGVDVITFEEYVGEVPPEFDAYANAINLSGVPDASESVIVCETWVELEEVTSVSD